MYVNFSLTAQRIQKFVLVLGSFGLETALTREKISVWESLFSLKFRWIPKDADLSGEKAGTLSGTRQHLLKTLFF